MSRGLLIKGAEYVVEENNIRFLSDHSSQCLQYQLVIYTGSRGEEDIPDAVSLLH